MIIFEVYFCRFQENLNKCGRVSLAKLANERRVLDDKNKDSE